MRIKKTIIFSLVLGIVLTLVSTIRFETESVPDLVVSRYGLPFFWLHHQTISIAGVIDIWAVHWLFLVGNLIFWCVISVAIIYALQRFQN